MFSEDGLCQLGSAGTKRWEAGILASCGRQSLTFGAPVTPAAGSGPQSLLHISIFRECLFIFWLSGASGDISAGAAGRPLTELAQKMDEFHRFQILGGTGFF